jgi:hypothetical protein
VTTSERVGVGGMCRTRPTSGPLGQHRADGYERGQSASFFGRLPRPMGSGVKRTAGFSLLPTRAKRDILCSPTQKKNPRLVSDNHRGTAKLWRRFARKEILNERCARHLHQCSQCIGKFI